MHVAPAAPVSSRVGGPGAMTVRAVVCGASVAAAALSATGCRARQGVVRLWAQQRASDGSVNNAAGRCPGDAVWRSLVKADLAAAEGGVTAEFLWDVSKAFDRAQRAHLFYRARDLGYPLTVRRLSLDSYGWTRRLLDRHLVSRDLGPSAGIAA